MWRYRLRWYLQTISRKHFRWNKSYRSTSLGAIALLFTVIAAGIFLLRTVWTIFMNGFLQAAPWVQGTQISTYYWNSAGFALKCTLTIGVVIILVAFFLGIQITRVLRR